MFFAYSVFGRGRERRLFRYVGRLVDVSYCEVGRRARLNRLSPLFGDVLFVLVAREGSCRERGLVWAWAVVRGCCLFSKTGLVKGSCWLSWSLRGRLLRWLCL